jgi:hypothetical protein
MSEEHTPDIMPVAQYARMRGVSERTIRYQIEQGRIETLPDGRIDAVQADESWWIRRNARSTMQGEAGRRNAQAKLIDAGVRIRLARHQLEAMRERYIDRSETSMQIANEIQAFVSELHTLPISKQYQRALAADLRVTQAAARRILERFVTLILSEIGDLEAAGQKLTDA